ncbi:MAG: DUF3267 domain-containing protein [Saccharofermentans sp.]|nr:DUF3267 domain-containing protein [Saccharofermentans sp.]
MSEEKNKEMLEQLNAAEEKASGKKNEPVTNSDGHVLTEAEIKRQQAFDEKEKKLLAQGYERHDILISVVKANFVGILLTLPFIIAVAAGFIAWNGIPDIPGLLKNSPVMYFVGLFGAFLACIPLAVVHEKIHGWFWSIGAENGSKDIEFGFMKETLTPYCTCASPLSKPLYILGSMMPMTILGVVIGIIAVFTGSIVLLIISVIQIMGGAGDILISAMLLFRKSDAKETILLDHPTKIGLVAFERGKK